MVEKHHHAGVHKYKTLLHTMEVTPEATMRLTEGKGCDLNLVIMAEHMTQGVLVSDILKRKREATYC